MSEKQELLIKKGVFLIEKYLFPKKKISYLAKGFSGAIIFWIYEFLNIFGGVANYQEMVSDSLKQIHSSEELRSQLIDFRHSPMFLTSILAVIVLSLVIGYLIMSLIHLIFDLIKRRVFKEFDSCKPL